MAKKKSVATVSLAGCFGCHMSLLDIDLRAIELFQSIDLLRSPLNDLKKFTGNVDIGLIEGGVCNDENVHVLRDFRKHCRTLVSLGECATMGGLPALRNGVSLKDCLEEAYIDVPTTPEGCEIIPCHEDIPKLLDKVYPCHEVVTIDYFIPGCPPSADTIWSVLTDLVHDREPKLDYGLLKYD